MKDTTKVKQLWELAKSRRTIHEPELKECYLYTIPHRQFGLTQGTLPDTSKLYDTTAIRGVNNLVTLTMRLLVPQNDQWAGVEIKDEFIKRIAAKELRDGIAATNRKLFEHFQQSTFYMAAGESMSDNVIIGTAAIAIYDNGNGIQYVSIPVSQVSFLEDHMGAPSEVFREHKMSVGQLVERFGDKCPKVIHDKVKTSPKDEYTILESEIPVTVKERMTDPNTGKSIMMPVTRYEYAVYLTSDWTEIECAVSAFKTFIVWRWDKAPGELWGTGPVRQALPAIRQANEWVKLMHAFGEYAAFGLWQTDDETIDLEQLKGKLTPGTVLAIEGGLKPVEFPGQFQISQAMVEDQRQQIRELLFSDSLPPADKPNYMTAEEIKARQSEFYRRVGEPALRLEREFLLPVIKWTIARMQARGDIAMVPDEVLAQLGIAETDLFSIVVNSAVKRIIRMNEAQNDIAAISTVAQVLGPQVAFKHANVDVLARKLYADMGMSSEVIRSEEDVEALTAQEAQLNQANQAMNAGNQMAEMMKKLGGSGVDPAALMGGGQ